MSRFEQAYFFIHTASAMNNKYARFLIAIFIENGLIPSQIVTEMALNNKFAFLQTLDPTAIIFNAKNLSLQKFESITQSAAI